MLSLTSPVASISKVGPKFQMLLEKLDIFTIEDLIYHFPYRYNDLSTIKPINTLISNEIVTVKATLVSVENIFTKNRKRITSAKFQDNTGDIEAIWFNMHFLKKSLKVNEIYNVSGKVGEFNNKICFISPDLEETNKTNINTGRLVPIYQETMGISSKWIRTRINDILHSGIAFEEFLPENILKKYNFVKFREGLMNFHFPNSLIEVDHAKKRFAFEEMFMEMMKVEQRKDFWARKLVSHRLEKKKYEKELKSLIKSLPFELSESQKLTLDEIFEEINRETPMNMLLEGDVGSGKTIVALISAYLTYLNGFKVMYMAPTEILADQHFETFKKYLEPLGIKIAKKTGTSKHLPEDFEILIGTHALIYVSEQMQNIGLIIIDEQQRFGVEQRAQLLKLGHIEKVPHLLTMTATPIPRTLALTLYGDLTICSIKPHKERYKNIKTWIVSENKREEAFRWAAEKKVPIFVVCPLIEESEFEIMENVKAAEVEYEKLVNGAFKELRVGLLHGRMKPKDKQDIVDKFRNGNLDVLVATPVIEVGIDIPDATIMIIESSERYGLASLHQLRGRIGRNGQEAYCMLFMSKYSRNGLARLKNLEKHNEGLKLSEIDLTLRGQGDLYGTRQHGFLNFRVADPSDFKLLEVAKADAQNYYPHLDLYPELKSKLEKSNIDLIGKN